jgi:hypothetical protein
MVRNTRKTRTKRKTGLEKDSGSGLIWTTIFPERLNGSSNPNNRTFPEMMTTVMITTHK